MRHRYFKLVVVALVVTLGGCDLKEQARTLLYGSDDGPSSPGERAAEEETRLTETEPNDSADRATTIEVQRDMQPMYASIDPADDIDWFALELDADESWMVELSVEPIDEQLDVAIYLEVPGGGDEAPLLYDIAGAGEVETIPMLNLPAEEAQRFFVSGVDDTTGDYRVTVRRRLSAAAVAMAPNDHPHLASTLEVPGEVQGFYDRPHDRDIFFVPAESLKAGIYSLELSAISGLTQRLEIYRDDSLEAPVMVIPVSERRPAVIPNLSLSADDEEGLYFVLSSGESYDREQGYRLRLIEHPPPEANQQFVVEREPNDTAATAQNIEFETPIRGYLHTADDVDRFYFEIEGEDEDGELDEDGDDAQQEEWRDFDPRDGEELDEEQAPGGEEEEKPEIIDPWEGVAQKEVPEYVVQTRLEPLGDGHRLAMSWIPGTDTGLSRSEVRAAESDEALVICNRVLGPGRYDIEVRSVGTDDGFRLRSFDYELEILNIAEKPSLEIEPNDTPEKADRLPMGESRLGFIDTDGDVDVYAFVVGPDEPVVVESGDDENGDEQEFDDDSEAEEEVADGASTTGWEAPETENVEIFLEGNRLNLGFEILDDEGGRVANVNRSGPGADEELSIDLPHGLYYVAVSASSGSLCESYQIEVNAR